MADYPHLSRAPISEAIIDFRVKPRESVTVTEFRTLRDQLHSRFPTDTEIRQFAIALQPGQPSVAQEQQTTGLLFKSSDEKTLVQFRLDGFTYNRLAPYTSWDEIFPETLRLWALYVKVARPESVVRVATRYINRLELPLPIGDLDDYLTAAPRVPASLPQHLRGYLQRLVIYDTANDHSLILTQAPEANPLDLSRATLLLDIDAFKDVDQVSPESDELRGILMLLRDAKNAAFFGSITARTLDMYR